MLVAPKPAYRITSGRGRPSGAQGQNPLPGVILDYYLPKATIQQRKLEILQEDEVVRTYTNQKPKAPKTGQDRKTCCASI